MIAPIERPKVSASSPGIRRARRLVASAFLKERREPTDCAPAVAAWRAWLFAAWVVFAAGMYFVWMADWF